MNVSKAVLITGCSSGIGWATAERLADVGWRVYATARQVEAIAPLEEQGCELLPLDVTDEDSMRSAVDEVERREGPVGGRGGGADGEGARPVRDERLRARTDVPARAARDAAARVRQDRQRLLHGRQIDVPRRRLLPRLQARRRGAERRAALRGRRLRRQGLRYRARTHQDQLRASRRRLDGRLGRGTPVRRLR